MKKGLTYVDASLIEAAIKALGLAVVVQKGFVKVGLGPAGRTLYVGKTARVGRVDISGFTMPEGTEGIISLGEGERNGAVHSQVDFEGRTEAEILATITEVMKYGMTLPDREKDAPRARGVSKLPEAKGWSFAPVKTGKELIARVAAEMGVEVSASSQNEEPTEENTAPEATESLAS